jgi:hypothetical protein
MTTTLPQLYGFLDGNIGGFLAWIRKTYGLGDQSANNPDRLRREAIAQRVRLYRDGGRIDMERMVSAVFETQEVIDQRKKLIDVACEQNVWSRITDEVASLYDQPAQRSFKDDVTETERFRQLSEDLELDEVFQEAHHLLFVCNEVLLWLVDAVDADSNQTLRIVTPDSFAVVPHPKNALVAAGFLIDACPSFVPEGADRARLKHYELWDAVNVYDLDANGDLVGSPRAHELGRIPGVLFHWALPVDRVLDPRPKSDITAAHLGVALLEIMIMRLSKSQGERQPALQGDLARMASGQTMDGEKPLLLPPGVVAMMLDMKTTPEHYLAAKKDKISSVALAWGMSYEQYTNSDTADTSSGKAFQIRRLKLIELRAKQRRRARVHEKLVAQLLGFDVKNFRVRHQEQAIPQDAVEEVALLQVMMRLGLDSIVKYVMRKNPEMSREEATAEINENLRDWAVLVKMLRALNMPSTADGANPGQNPQQNGALDANGNPVDNGANDGSGTPQSAIGDVMAIERGKTIVAS